MPGARGARVLGVSLRLRAAAAPPAERPRLLRRAVEELRGCGDRLEHARALADLAGALQLTGEGNRAGPLALRAWHLAADCGARALCDQILPGHRDPAPDPAPGTPAGGGSAGGGGAGAAGRLRASERRVASLAALGYTNREIAATLYVTVSTVEQHLSRAYRTLGISGRRQLPADLRWERAPGRSG
jgi:DNA-binding CsgD family transcriptional regulator